MMNAEEHHPEVLNTLNVLRKPDEVIEVRMIGTKQGTVSGYYNDSTKLLNDIHRDIGTHDIFITLNPVHEDLIARAENRLQVYAKQTTKDNEIKHLSYVLIDIDSIRPSGISATNEEKQAALDLGEKIGNDLLEQGFPEVIAGDSGNGYHLLLPIDLENTKENTKIIQDFLSALNFLYSNEQAEVDVTTYNPARIVKLYGTTTCKGDNTNERPHRSTKLLNVPEKRGIATIEQLQSIASKKPVIERQKVDSKGSINGKIDVSNFIEKHGLDLAFSSTYQSDATKFILKTCPWNSDHTDNAAYIIQFDNGAIAAGCHHNGCSDENWQSLKKLVGEEEVTPTSKAKEESTSDKQSDILIALTERNNFKYFTNEMDEAYVAVQVNNHEEVLKVKSKKFQLFMMKLFYESERTPIGADAMKQAIGVLEMKAVFSENELKLQNRMNKLDGTYYYDLCDRDWRVVKINEDGCEIQEESPCLFTRTKNMNEQVEPDFTIQPNELYQLVKKHFRFKKEADLILFTVYLVTCFLPEISQVILVLYGEKGAAKSTTMQMIKRIVDPAKQDLLSMPTSKDDLAITLFNNSMTCFDNLDSLSAGISDMLCMAVTGGAISKRALYTDSEEIILRIKRKVVLNGINIVATRADLLDRSVLLELDRIPKDERKTDHAIWKAFDEDVPKFLGAIMNTLSASISRFDEVELDEMGRMADFTERGFAIAEVLGLNGKAFLEAYLQNQSTANEEALLSHPVAATVLQLMQPRTRWVSSVTDLLRELERVAGRKRININDKSFPRDANVLSKRLKEVKSNLEEVGITYSIRHAGTHKEVTIIREGELLNLPTQETTSSSYAVDMPSPEDGEIRI